MHCGDTAHAHRSPAGPSQPLWSSAGSTLCQRMLLNGDLQHQGDRLGTGEDRGTCPSPVAGTQWGQAVFLLPAAAQEPPAAQGSSLGAGLTQDVAASCMQAHCWRHWVTAGPFPWPALPAPGSWECMQTTTNPLHPSASWSLCIPCSVHPWLMPPTPPSASQLPSSVRLLGAGEGCGESWPYREGGASTCPTPCSPGPAQGQHQPGRAHWEMCKRCWGHLKVRRVSGCLSPGSPAPRTGWQDLGERKSPAEKGGGVCVQSGLL